ncbi:hypothetical protein EFP18_07395 [Burkholderia glumae]|nr:hypothetical protein CEQ24_001025 [Burkholderia glumae]QGA40345.1 hypothetical protein GAS19_22695 [Burkholderia glumae]RQZ72050.1 hypothetical protein DF052_17140 [Burkholderia glumae]UVS84010.1 hypothetical protein EFP18_07395 [Burkholderia glumae]UVS92644.1 hypothetical protein EFP17_23320 [Burkholderia glumae]
MDRAEGSASSALLALLRLPGRTLAERNGRADWRKIRGSDKNEPLLKGIPFKDGTPVISSAPPDHAARPAYTSPDDGSWQRC